MWPWLTYGAMQWLQVRGVLCLITKIQKGTFSFFTHFSFNSISAKFVCEETISF
uniref:Uncharacterized protein n=2 Tax=Anguilla anguilla TaxID=7936 RepID=A0A0E9TTJ9_ANGAN